MPAPALPAPPLPRHLPRTRRVVERQLTSHTISVAATRVQNPWMWKPPTIAVGDVQHQHRDEEPDDAQGEDGQREGGERRSGLSRVLSTPNTAAAASSEPKFLTVTPESSPATTASTNALVSHEMPSRTASGGAGGGRSSTTS